jgi:diaminobutyrate--2-oxoglutarate aminotransferase
MKLADLFATIETAPFFAAERPAPPADSAVMPAHRTIHELVRKQARVRPEAVAVVSPDLRLTYEELDRRSENLAYLLTQHGVAPEEFVLLLMARSVEVVVAMLAVLKAGAAYVPVLPTDPVERLQYIARNTRSRLLIANAELDTLAKEVRSVMSDDGLLILLGSDEGLPGARTYATGSPNGIGEGLLINPDALNEPREPVIVTSTDANLAYLMHTSGTTGRPKGVMIEHRSVVRLVIEPGYFEIGPDDRILQTGSLAFDAATFEVWGALLNGASVFLAPHEAFLQPEALRKLIDEQGITILFLTTMLFNQLVDSRTDVFAGLRVLLTGGERVSALHMMRHRCRHPEIKLFHVYGPTENTTFTTAFLVEKQFDVDVPIGSPIAGNSAFILDAQLREQPIGTIGQLCAGGSGLARGYLNDPGLTAEKFIPHPSTDGQRIYQTGDLARLSVEHGSKPVFEYCDRIDSQIKIRGFRIEPGEIEARLREISGVKDAVIVADALQDGSRSLVAYLVGENGLDPHALRAACRKVLPEYMVPADFIVIDHLPLNVNGKVDREVLPLPDRESRHTQAGIHAAASSTVFALRAIWEEILGRTDFSDNDDFFDIGGHSLLAVQMISLVEERMKIELPINVIFDAPTLRELTQHALEIARFGVAALDDGMVLMAGEPSRGGLFAFPPGTADCLGYSDLARTLSPQAFYGFTFLESEDRIRRYAELIQSTPLAEPYHLFGYSSGGNLAYHVAAELESLGKQVASVIMLDSGRRLAQVPIPREKAAQIADEFLSSDDAKQYLGSVVLREKAHRNIIRNLDYISESVDAHTVKASIHLVTCEDSIEQQLDETGRLVISKSDWAQATFGRFLRYKGAGDHDHMLFPPHFAKNAELIQDIIAGRARADITPTDQSSVAVKVNGNEEPLATFDQLESRVRSYCHSFPTIFAKAQGALLYDRNGKTYIDLFSGAGSLNYGHNHPAMKQALMEYIASDGIAHALDMATVAKERFLQKFHSIVLQPRSLDYRLQFVGPTGANGIEAGLKLARKVRCRGTVVAFTNSYHGLSSGALSVTANTSYRGEFYTQRSNVAFMPFDGYLGDGVDSLDYFERCLTDCGSGLDQPAAVVAETVQAEGGINVASVAWLQRLEQICRRFGILLIIDDIQVGCGRTGTFFSFERAGLYPDMVVLSKSISGFGLPMSMVLVKPELDLWESGEHSGTFRGNNLAFVTAAVALDLWRDADMESTVRERSLLLASALDKIANDYPQLAARMRGVGLVYGFEIAAPETAQRLARECFKHGLIIELCGPRRNVLKFLPPLLISPSLLHEAIVSLRASIESFLSQDDQGTR